MVVFSLILIILLAFICYNIYASDIDEGYDGYSYEYGYEDGIEAAVGLDGDATAHATHTTASTGEGTQKSPTNSPSFQREKDKKEERRKEALRLQQELKEKQLRLAAEEERKADALAEAAAKDKERVDFANNGGGQGYKKSVAKGMNKVMVSFANDRFLNITALQIDCVPMDKWGAKALPEDADATADGREVKMRDALSRVDGTFVEGDEEGNGDVKDSPVKKERKFDNPKVKTKPKKPTFRELQEKKMRERKDKEAAKEAARGSFQLGSTCEGIVCTSCKVLVEEFGGAVIAGVSNPDFAYVEDVLPPFCNRKEVQQRYIDLVGGMCESIVKERVGYKEAFLLPFEQDSVWTAAAMATSIMNKKKKVCSDIGACQAGHFQVALSSQDPKKKHWDDKCYVCQAFATELEERLQLRRAVSEGETSKVVSSLCDHLPLPDNLLPVCRELSSGPLQSDIAWLAYMHAEAIPRKKKANKLFKDQLCEEVKFCEAWVDEEEAAKEQAKKVEPVFF